MDWLGLHFITELPDSGQVILQCTHYPVLVLLAYLVACATSFATQDMAERVSHAERPNRQRLWRWLGAGCLAAGLWSVHFIAILALEVPLNTHYHLPLILISLPIALATAWLVMNALSHEQLSPWRYGGAALSIGLGICGMHYMGIAALRTSAHVFYQPQLIGLSLLLAIGCSLALLLLSRHLREGSGMFHQLRKYTSSLALAGLIMLLHFTEARSISLVLPAGSPPSALVPNSHLQLGLTLSVISLLIIASMISAAVADKKLQQKERDLRRVNALLSQLDQARFSLLQVAHYDALTNLINRRGFNQLFAEKLMEASTFGGMLAVIFLDIDHFKRINDSLGHDAGDELLKAIAGHIKSSTRCHEDVVARLGGDEFCILVNLRQRDEAQQMARRIMQRMKEPIELAGRRMVMTTSIGISIFPDDGETCDELLKNADLALYQSKDAGRNSLHFFSSTLKTRATLELQLEEELRNALRDDQELLLYYQPIYDLRSARVTKLEALIRWQHPQHGLLAPDRFINIAEANGMIAELDNWVLRKACEDLAYLSRQGCGDLKIAVNCSALNLTREDLPGEIESARTRPR